MSKIDETWRKPAIGQKERDLPDDNANIIKYIEALQAMIARARHEEDKTNGNLEITIEFEEDAAEETSEQNPPNDDLGCVLVGPKPGVANSRPGVFSFTSHLRRLKEHILSKTSQTGT